MRVREVPAGERVRGSGREAGGICRGGGRMIQAPRRKEEAARVARDGRMAGRDESCGELRKAALLFLLLMLMGNAPAMAEKPDIEIIPTEREVRYTLRSMVEMGHVRVELPTWMVFTCERDGKVLGVGSFFVQHRDGGGGVGLLEADPGKDRGGEGDRDPD